MYKSPIETIFKQMRTEHEANVWRAIQDCDIVVDKEELIKALKYDRGQYAKGYADCAEAIFADIEKSLVGLDAPLDKLYGISCRKLSELRKKYLEGNK